MMASIDVNINATFEVDDAEWYDLLELNDGDEQAALDELLDSLEYEDGYTEYGRWWGCSVESNGWIEEPRDRE